MFLFRDRRPTVSINKIDKIDRVDVNVPFYPILADIIVDRLAEYYQRTTPQFTASPLTRTKFEPQWLKIVEAAGKILSVLSGIAIIVFISLLIAGKAQIGSLQVTNLLTIMSFTLIGGLLSIGGVNVFSIKASLRRAQQQLVQVISTSGGCPFALIADEEAKRRFGVRGLFEIGDKGFCDRCQLVDHHGRTICKVSPHYREG
jgi:hypothetical protein